ncbi:MAG: FAD:protein FMN transferase [Clostridiales bacterium]|nr:FAD:protein FMN transferase [Clostridiales bacterium]
MKPVTFIFMAAVALSMSLPSCVDTPQFQYLDGAAWNTTYHVKYEGPETLGDSIQSVFQLIEMSLSPFNDSSLVSAVNRGDSVTADSLFIEAFQISRWVNGITDGAFDPTLSPLINLWGFGYDHSHVDGFEPSDSLVAEALALVGIGDCYIDPLGYVHKKHRATTFNFSAVAKGYGCDLIAGILHRNGVDNYMVEIGGEIALNGFNERGKPWRVMIDAPREESVGNEGVFIIELTEGGVATSGNYRNYRNTGHGKIGHTISPRTGRPVQTDILSATVIAPSCAIADALATAVMTMPSDSAVIMLNSIENVKAIIVNMTGDGEDVLKVGL